MILHLTYQMYLKRLHIRNFRNIADEVIEFSSKINIFIGENGQGKSNLLEAIHFLSTGRSFRGALTSELIAHGENYFSLEAVIERDGFNEYLSVYFDESKKKIVYNDNYFSMFSQLLGILPSVLLAPQDLQFIIGFPSVRRRFLNIHIAQCDPLYVYHLTRYIKAMKHRNTLLKEKKLDTIEIFEKQMEVSGNYLIEQRSKATESLHQNISQYYSQMSSKQDQLEFKYLPSCKTDEFFNLMKKNRKKESILKSTLYGPHRDDFQLLLDHKFVKTFASEGQKRTVLSALKFAELKRINSIYNNTAILGIDDFGVHLDEMRQSLLFKATKTLNQVMLTSPTLTNSIEGKKFLVKSGKITAA